MKQYQDGDTVLYFGEMYRVVKASTRRAIIKHMPCPPWRYDGQKIVGQGRGGLRDDDTIAEIAVKRKDLDWHQRVWMSPHPNQEPFFKRMWTWEGAWP